MQATLDTAGATPLVSSMSDKRRAAVVETFGQHFYDTFKSPIIFMDDWTLESLDSNRFFKKDFSYLSLTLYREYDYRTWREFDQEKINRFEEVITTKITNIRTLMKNWATRIQKLMEQAGLDSETALFPTQRVVTVPIITVHARSYLLMLRDLDNVINLAGTANLMGVLDSKQRADAEYICKKAIRAFRNVMQQEIKKLWGEASRVVQAQRATGKAVPKAIEDMVADQSKQITAFDAAEKADADAGEDTGLGGMDPNTLIDNAVAASNAAVAASTKPRKAKAAAAKADSPVSA